MAAGDPIYLRRTDSVTLSGAQVSALASWLTQIWPSAQPADLDDLTIYKNSKTNNVFSSVNETRSVTAAQYIALQLSGSSAGLQDWDGYNAATYSHALQSQITGTNLTDLVSMISSVWPGVAANTMDKLIVTRSNGNVEAILTYEDSTDPDSYMQLLEDGYIDQLLGTE